MENTNNPTDNSSTTAPVLNNLIDLSGTATPDATAVNNLATAVNSVPNSVPTIQQVSPAVAVPAAVNNLATIVDAGQTIPTTSTAANATPSIAQQIGQDFTQKLLKPHPFKVTLLIVALVLVLAMLFVVWGFSQGWLFQGNLQTVNQIDTVYTRTFPSSTDEKQPSEVQNATQASTAAPAGQTAPITEKSATETNTPKVNKTPRVKTGAAAVNAPTASSSATTTSELEKKN